MFFTVSDSFGSLHRANLDGTNYTKIASYKIFYPTSLKLDIANKQIYWLDKYMDFIERVDYDGKNRWSMKSYPGTSMRRTDSIALFENQIFLSKRSTNRREMWRVNRRDGNQAKMIMVNERQPLELRVFHRQIQPDAINPCIVKNSTDVSTMNSNQNNNNNNNNGCEHLCVPAYDINNVSYAQCVCIAGYQLKSQTKCVFVKHTSFLIYAKQIPTMIRGISMSSADTLQEAIVPILNVKWPLSLDYNTKNQLIYFAQNDM